jgi:hypothetical protein
MVADAIKFTVTASVNKKEYQEVVTVRKWRLQPLLVLEKN